MQSGYLGRLQGIYSIRSLGMGKKTELDTGNVREKRVSLATTIISIAIAVEAWNMRKLPFPYSISLL
jgi:hypothetical protein